MRFWNHFLNLRIIKLSGIFYKSPSNFNYWYNFGFLAMFCLVLQMLTGIILSMFYKADILVAHVLVISITNELYYGWFLRSLHANGASFFFLTVYIHMARGIYYGSYVYPRQMVWLTGSLIWVLMIVTAFTGYILPWGQMSFWGAMVITNLVAAIPLIGDDLVYLLWGGFTVGTATLERFYTIHFCMPFIIFMISYIHFALLHEYGSTNPLGLSVATDEIPFVPYYGIKDIFSVTFVLVLFFFLVFFSPLALGHSDNLIEANFLVTPPHIVPEWYFLPLYCILRSVPNKLLGLILIVFFILSIFLLPFLNKGIVKSSIFKPYYTIFVWIFFSVCILLGWIGGLPVIYPFYTFGQILTFLYFFILLIIFPFLNFLETAIYLSYVQVNLNKKNI